MRVAFLDDREQASPPRAGLGHLFAFAAAIFPEEGLAPFAEDLSGIAAGLGIPAGEEIKWNRPRGNFLKSADGQLVKALRRRMLEAALDPTRVRRPDGLPPAGSCRLQYRKAS